MVALNQDVDMLEAKLENIEQYPCEQCQYQATSKRNLARHRRAVHEGIKYPCGQCQHEATSKVHLARHRRAVHEGIKYHCGQM